MGDPLWSDLCASPSGRASGGDPTMAPREVFVSIASRQIYLWRAVDDEGEVLDVLVQVRRDKAAALRLMRKMPL